LLGTTDVVAGNCSDLDMALIGSVVADAFTHFGIMVGAEVLQNSS
jgi:hypothetical protein